MYLGWVVHARPACPTTRKDHPVLEGMRPQSPSHTALLSRQDTKPHTMATQQTPHCKHGISQMEWRPFEGRPLFTNGFCENTVASGRIHHQAWRRKPMLNKSPAFAATAQHRHPLRIRQELARFNHMVARDNNPPKDLEDPGLEM